MWIPFLEMTDLEAGKQPRIQFTFENSGKAAAFDVTAETAILPVNAKQVNEPPGLKFTTLPAKAFVPPGGSISKTWVNPMGIDQGDVDRITRGEQYSYVYGAVRYIH